MLLPVRSSDFNLYGSRKREMLRPLPSESEEDGTRKTDLLRPLHSRRLLSGTRQHPYTKQRVQACAQDLRETILNTWKRLNAAHQVCNSPTTVEHGEEPMNLNEMKEVKLNTSAKNESSESERQEDPTSDQKWRLTLPMTGFRPENIKTLLFRSTLYVVAKWSGQSGEQRFGVTKRLALPSNVDRKKLKVGLSQTGVLVLEAPLKLQSEEQTENHNERSEEEIRKNAKQFLELLKRKSKELKKEQCVPDTCDNTREFKVPSPVTPIDDENSEKQVRNTNSLEVLEKSKEKQEEENMAVDSTTENEQVVPEQDKTDQTTNTVGQIYEIKFQVDNFPSEKLELFVKNKVIMVYGEAVMSDGDTSFTRSANRYFTVPDNVDLKKIRSSRVGDGPLVIQAPLM